MMRKEEKIFSTACGFLCVGLAAIFALMSRVMYRNHMLDEANGSHHLLRSISLPILLLAVAIFLFLSRRWAQVGFALICGAVGGWLIVGSLFEVPFPWMLFNIAFGFVLFAPLLFIFRYWKVQPKAVVLHGR